MMLDKERIKGHFIEKCIDTTFSIRVDGYDHSMTPLGDDDVFTLKLGSDVRFEYHHEQYESYWGMHRDSYIVVRGQWELKTLQEDRFAIQIIHPEVEVIEGLMNPEALLNHYQKNCMFVGTGNIWFSPCPESDTL